MNRFASYGARPAWLIGLVLSALAAGCSGDQGRGRILGTGVAELVPTVTAVAPANNATGVPFNTHMITAGFSTAMNPGTLTAASFTLACPMGSPIAGAVSYAVAGSVATLTLPAGTNLPPNTVCTATITTAAQSAVGVPLAGNSVWTFTTGTVFGTTRPTVRLTVPATTIPGPTAGAPANVAITAVFSTDMAPATITAASFTVTCTAPCVSPAGTVTYAVGSRTADFTPAAALTIGATYTATITSAATDASGNALAGNQAPLPAASNYVWTFTVVAAVAPGNVSVLSTNPTANAVGVCPSASVNATFTAPAGVRMDPVTVNASTFTVTGPAPASTPVPAGSVVLDAATGRIATFTPMNANAFTSGVTYTATIKGGASGVKDLAVPADAMASDFTWSFTAGPASGCAPTVNLGTAASFAIAAAAGMTNTPTVPVTTINGNVVLTPTPTCNAVAWPGCGGTAPIINGTVLFGADPAAIAVRADLRAAYNSITPANLPGATVLGCGTIGTGGGAGILVGCAGNATLAPGVYISTSASTIGVTGVLTLDGQGNANATFVFQAPSALTTAAGAPGVPGSVIRLINGAKAANVWWQVGSSATIGTYCQFQGNVLADTSITMGTGATSYGRLLAGAVTASGAFAFDSNVVSVPAP